MKRDLLKIIAVERARGNGDHMMMWMRSPALSYKTAAVWARVVSAGKFSQHCGDKRTAHRKGSESGVKVSRRFAAANAGRRGQSSGFDGCRSCRKVEINNDDLTLLRSPSAGRRGLF